MCGNYRNEDDQEGWKDKNYRVHVFYLFKCTIATDAAREHSHQISDVLRENPSSCPIYCAVEKGIFAFIVCTSFHQTDQELTVDQESESYLSLA